MWCDVGASTPQRSVVSLLLSLDRWLTQPTAVACSPTACASARSSHLLPACLLMLACLCLLACLLASIEYGLTGALSLACLKIFPCLSTIALYGAAMGSCGHCVISPYAHAMPTASSQQALPLHSAMHETGITGMATETVSGRFETFCQADGMNAQPERSERFKTGFRRFALEWGDQAASASTSLCCS